VLSSNSLWRVLTSSGIWHYIIKDKYFSHFTVISWLQTDTATSRAYCFFWKNIIKSKYWILHGLCWQSASGHSITLGHNQILGLGDASFLTPQPITHLHKRNIWYLYQIRERSLLATLPERWHIARTQWWPCYKLELFFSALTLDGIYLIDRDDHPLWFGGDH